MVRKKEHLTTEGLNLILSIKAVMNGNGLSDKLQKSFPNLIQLSRPTRENNKNLIELSNTNYVGIDLVNSKIYDPC